MSKKLSYLKCKLLSKITTGKTKEHYLNKKRRLKNELIKKEYSFLLNALNHSLSELKDYLAYQKFYLLFKQRFNIDIPADVCGLGNSFELIRVPLKKLSVAWKGQCFLLSESPKYTCLKKHDWNIYLSLLDYSRKNKIISSTTEHCSLERFQKLKQKIEKEGYQPQKSAIVVNEDFYILDGQHRASILLYLHGGDYEIPVIQVSRR